ncbi:Benzil reductase ((S)-benzoin forming) [Legionella massiliensis]|uniref:Benzil reductase ((S)-benzoin forming) n=1 Tax=Legionella massiliensis TaxID=1034943 RepID=A0A078KWS7_9GAMM|nr:SDR family NAD(P)-dependent oxidoreductase [Legionella massiliensis]CDZ77437.1 Benzil reductase ((S)-benzoin forming) [Legionella massiliensis]CEE13175.1 Benzil reductase ((S)-benzoin forming) [Legionella massiliensis]
MYLITGGGSGIGRALALALAKRGKKILIVGRREQALVETASFSSLISYHCADVSTDKERKQLVAALAEVHSIDGLVHNAGTIQPISPIESISESAWQQILATNLNAPLFLTQLLIDKLKQGRVLHIGSGAAYFPVAGWSGYCVSKAALSMLTRCWQLEKPNLAMASVMPGIIDTDMQGLIRDAQFMEEEKHDFFINLHRNGLLLSPATVGDFLCWLLLDIEPAVYSSKEWDIYDKSHHQYWLRAPNTVPEWE